MNGIEFDVAYSAVTGERVSGVYVPHAEHDDDYDVLLDADPNQTTWRAITGKTGQYGYSGAVMHPSETASDELVREWVREAGGDVFVIVAVEDPERGYDGVPPVGWAVIYQDSEVTK